MGIGELQRMTAFRAGDAGPQVPTDVENLPLPLAYNMLTQLAPMVLEHQTKGTIAGVWLNKDAPDTDIHLGGYTLHATLGGWGRRNVSEVPIGFNGNALRGLDVVPDVPGYAIFMATGPDEFLMAGDNVQVTFSPDTPGPGFVGLAEQDAGHFENGKWVTTRYLARRRFHPAARPGQRRGHEPVGLRRAAFFTTAPFVRRARHPARESVPGQVGDNHESPIVSRWPPAPPPRSAAPRMPHPPFRFAAPIR